MRIVLIVAVLLVVAGMAYIRFAPSDPDRWHVDPVAAPSPGQGGWKVAPGGEESAPVWDATPAEVMAAVEAVAMETPRTTRLAGDPESLRLTYLTRSALMGFPDYTTVEALPAEGGTTVAILARLRFGGSDMGVNRARVEDWLARLSARLDRAGGN